MNENIVIVIAILLLVSIFYSLFVKMALSKSQLQLNVSKQDNFRLTQNLQQTIQALDHLRDEKNRMTAQLSQVQTQYENLKEKFKEQLDNKENEMDRFEMIANRVLERKTEKFDQQHKMGIKEILDPLHEKIKLFEARIEKTNIASIERHSALRHQIKALSELNERITEEANNLTRALKSDTKLQGNWGELILESILEKSGLEKDREYHIQQSITQNNGKRMQPDVVIDLPDRKKIIIDSKVSLVAYERFVNADSKQTAQSELKAHVQSIRNHINTLSEKNYHTLYQIESPDFVLLFVPIETAFSSVLKYDDRLYDYAFDKNIVIVTPSTLLATLKTVDTLWKNDKQNKNAMEIAQQAGKMYDKFVAFSDDMIKIGKQLDTVKNTYNDSMNKMSVGTGNLIRRAEKLKKLGAKANKVLPTNLVEMSD